ncbi:hypothetical protein BDY21DRAFT_351389 [Lineolata rhizophorae]|uniref:AMP-dependent synthetase/ligase domain-containing protein n=1 Tax=Lineolata rhizophorae TaxID=578093 RepID=A0A6A6NUI0_9PEZI|nr:hypothetical protein BDY21DRAFT_351389 [Lineolata rhizophorae]
MTNLKTLMPQPRAVKSGPFSVDAPGFEHVKGETIPRRNTKTKDGLKTRPHEDIGTIFDLVKYASAKFGNAKAIGMRSLVQLHHETKKVKKMVDGKQEMVDKKWTYFEMSGYSYTSFAEYEELTLKIGSGLRKLGMNAGEKIQLFASTSKFWLATAHGALSQSIPIVTAYDTLGEDGLRHSMQQTSASAVYVDPALLTKLINPLKAGTAIKLVIYNSGLEVSQADIDKLKEAHPELKVLSFDEVVKLGEENPVDPVPPKPEDLCCVMYTSGTTGTPKGVLLKHKNVVGAIAGVDIIVGDYLGPGDGLLTYLPLAHILEFVFENACLFWGGTMGYGSVRTLSDNSMRNCKGDIREFRPSILVGVPQVWETVRKGIVTKVNQGGALTKNLFWAAMSAKNFLMNTGLPGSGILDTVVFSKVKDATGGRLRICMNGGGPISKETQHFISMAITPMISGYGLTETSAMGALMDPLAWTDNALGEIPGSIEIKLVDFPDAGYFTDRKMPQGEIWIRGAAVTEGYLDLEKETKEGFTDDGWFKTGDIGEFDTKGQLKIIDRKKNLVKTLAGEYIALEKLESVYRSVPIVANICIYADPNKMRPVAIVVPAEPVLKQIAEQNGVQGDHLEELVHDEKLNKVVLGQLQAAGRKGGLASFEMIDGVVLADEEWTPQNGFTTAANKINRRVILDKYKKEVDKAYSESS